ncbi:MAG: capsular biosynthesis protein [Pseudomonadota bacterium]
MSDCTAQEPIRFTDDIVDWPAFFHRLVSDFQVDCVVLFGQTRLYHRKALEVAHDLGIAAVVLEEGYFRPGFATMELGGVNGYSSTMESFVWDGEAAPAISPHISSRHFQKMAWHAARHYTELRRRRAAFPNYVHHRIDDPFHYAVYWVRSWLRKLLRSGPDKRMQDWLLTAQSKYYFVPLQLDGDSQLVFHSTFGQNPEFIAQVITSFARNAPADALLVFKQHPHSRGGPGHAEIVRACAKSLGVGKRVHHLVEGDTPVLAEHSAGVVVINSTVGLQALERGAPLMVMGTALYDQPGLAFQGPLDDFWRAGRSPERASTDAFLLQLKNLTQVPASLYATKSEPLPWQTARVKPLLRKAK